MSYHSGQKVITTKGMVRTVAFVSNHNIVYAWSPNGGFEAVVPRYEAWGGEHDVEVRNAA